MQDSTILTFPVYSYRTIPTPLDVGARKSILMDKLKNTRNSQEITSLVQEFGNNDSQARFYTAIVNTSFIPKELEKWGEISKEYRVEAPEFIETIKGTLINKPHDFVMLNRGIAFSVKKAMFDNKSQIVTLAFSDHELHGIIDGWKTYQAIRSFIHDYSKRELEKKGAFITLNIMEIENEGIDIAEIVDGFHLD